jgi:L-alanine-DL-glutamate epimerase-like enolase superfamily enzyme
LGVPAKAPFRILQVRERTVSLAAPMRNAAIGFGSMTASALALVAEHAGRRVAGFAFDSIGRYGKGALLAERFLPRLLAASPASLVDASGLISPEKCAAIVMADEKGGGHGERPGAVGLIEAAAWDLRAKQLGLPLWKAIAERYGHKRAGTRISVYASCGHYREGDAAALADEVKRAVDSGYRCVKIKVAGDVRDDAARIGQASSLCLLAVDLNGHLPLERAREWFAAVASFQLQWIEEPAPPLDYELLARYTEMTPAPLATGENLFSFDDARNLLRYGGLRPGRDLIQVDPLLSYGVGEYVRILELFEGAGWRRETFMPHAGHLFAAHCVAGLGLRAAEAAPDASLPYGGWWDGVGVVDGTIAVPELPGVGFEGKANLHALLAPLFAETQGIS